MNNQLLILSIASIAAILAITGATQDAEAAGFAKIGDIKGEASPDREHQDWINLLSVSQAIERSSTNGASGSARHRASATFGDIVLVKEVDASTPKLQEAIATGENFGDVKIDFFRTVGGPEGEGKRVPYLQWELKNARVSSYSFSGQADNDPRPVEELSLNFEEIKVTYTKYGKDGSKGDTVEYTWKIEKGTK